MVIFSRVGATTLTDLGDSSDLNGLYSFLDNYSGNLWADAAAAGVATTITAPGFYRTSSQGGAAGGGAITSLDGVFRGLTALQANGTWTLTVRDAETGDTGTVNGASLVIGCGPWITSVTPATGLTSGFEIVYIQGDNFVSGATTVELSGTGASAAATLTTVQILTPVHAAGPVDVKVTTAYGEFILLGGFTYVTPGGGGGGGGDGGDDGGCSTGPMEGNFALGVFAAVLVLAMLRLGSPRRFRARLGSTMGVAVLATACLLGVAGCQTTRKAEADRRAQMDSYSYSYSYPKGGFPALQDKKQLRTLEEEGWRPVREERSTQGENITVTVRYEK